MSKKPRRVRTRRCEKNEICFFRRRVRREKHFSARKCASCPLKADSACAQRAAAFLEKVALPLFRQSQTISCRKAGDGLYVYSSLRGRVRFFRLPRMAAPTAVVKIANQSRMEA